MKVGVVKEFKGEYYFLSNFFYASFEWRGVQFPTGEHAFAYAKSFCAESYIDEMAAYHKEVLAATTPGEAKKLGRGLNIDVKEWDERKVSYMREIVHAKFKNNLSDIDMVGKLINTGAMMLVEGNDWGDSYWGRCLKNGKWVGYNTLGALLTEERGYWLKGKFNDN